ncbi:MAG TPA: SRPBCC family protein [Candidatus Dormibacteraeota bacterium]|nr:SRPBCC family protein [Candidatus Dormibacteraeota bacterium]
MASAEHTVTIDRPASEVFDYVARGENAQAWRNGVLDIAHVSGSGVGATYRQGVRGPGGRRVAADYRITEYEPARRLGFQAIAGPVRPTGLYQFEDLGGRTRLTFSLSAELGLVQRLVLGGMVQRTMDAEVASTERLKQVLESAAAPA